MVSILTITILVVCMIVTSSMAVALDWHFTEPNIALNKNTTQSSTGVNGVSNRAVDGNTTADYNQGSCTHTSESEASAWLAVYLDGNYKLSGIIIYNRSTHKFRLEGFKVIGQSASSTSVVLYDESNVNTPRYNDSIIPIQLDDARLFSSINITIPQVPLTLCEVQIFAACQPPTDISNGKYSPVHDGYGVGSMITAICDNGYTLYWSNQMTCQRNGSWSAESKCIDDSCNNPNDLINGKYIFNGVIYESGKRLLGDVITVMCDRGYKLTSGPSQKTCTLYEVLVSNMYVAWNGTSPTCSLITCSWPVTFTDGHYEATIQITEKNSVPYGTVLHAVCDNDLFKFTGDENWTCGDKGIWSGATSSCALVSTPQCQIQAGPIIGAFIGGIVLTAVVMVVAALLRRRYIAVGTMCCPDKVTTRTDEHEYINDLHARGEYEHRIELESVNRDAANVYAETVPANSNEHVYSGLNIDPENKTEILDSKSDYENVNQ